MLPAFVLTIFLSASLLFLVQPMVAKMVLPLLGGSPAVWNTSMVFFQAVLLAGYLYAHLLTRRLAPARQVLVHAIVLTLPLIIVTALGRLPIIDPRELPEPGSVHPALWLLGGLLIAVGGPFFVLSTTGPLMQRWFSSTTHRHAKDPYFLYAASNIGSMLALAGYPLVMERTLTLQDQRAWFAVGYAAFIVLAIACGVLMLRARPVEPASRQERRRLQLHDQAPAPETPLAPLSYGTRLRWVLLAAVPSSLMLGVTQHISSDIASVPLMWVAPLAIYLLTFILAFGARAVDLPKLSNLYFVLASCVALMVLARMSTPVWAVIGAHLLALFLGAMVCHGRLAQERPDPRRLTEFYLLIALGGVLGGSFNALAAPVIFNAIAEYPIAIVGAALLAVPGFADRKPPLTLPRAAAAREIAWFTIVALAGAVVFAWAVRGGVRPGPPFWTVFGALGVGLGGYVVWRLYKNPVSADAIAPVSVILLIAGFQYSFSHAAPVGDWQLAAAAGLALALLGTRFMWPGGGAPSLAADFGIPVLVGLCWAGAHRATTRAEEVPVDGQTLVLQSISTIAVFVLPCLLLLMSQGRRLRVALAVGCVFWLVYTYSGAVDPQLLTSRTFFGVHRVSTDRNMKWRLLSHGTTRHGIQHTDPLLSMYPTMYYHPTGPIGQIFKDRNPDPEFNEIAIIGLGTGGLSAFGREGQTITYYEIDPEVVWIAQDSGLFTFLRDTPARIAPIVLGDGRLEMAKAPPGKYDMIIVDAFSSDSIPIHLITREAISLYFEKLAPDGIIAFHISNRYLELRPILGAIAAATGTVAAVKDDIKLTDQERVEGKLPTTWVVMARHPDHFRAIKDDETWIPLLVREGTPLWTDDYSNILPVLMWK